jgi:hypothetical protein
MISYLNAKTKSFGLDATLRPIPLADIFVFITGGRSESSVVSGGVLDCSYDLFFEGRLPWREPPSVPFFETVYSSRSDCLEEELIPFSMSSLQQNAQLLKLLLNTLNYEHTPLGLVVWSSLASPLVPANMLSKELPALKASFLPDFLVLGLPDLLWHTSMHFLAMSNNSVLLA